MTEGKFGLFEAVCFTSLIITSKLFYTNVGMLVKAVGTAAWQSSLLSCLTSLFFFYLIYLLMKRFPGKNIFEIFQAVLGKLPAAILGLAFSAYAVFYAGSNLREFVEMIKAYNLPYTPTSVIIAAVILVAVLLAYYGLESLVRISTICFLPVLAGIVIILLLASPSYDPQLLKPYFGYGFFYTLQRGFLRSSGYSEVIVLAIIINSLHGVKNFRKAGVISLSLSGAVFVASTALYVMSFGYPVAGEKIAGMFELTRGIYFNRFFQRIESIFLFMWVLASVITVSVSVYLAVSSYCKIFRLGNHRPLLFPFAFLVFMVSILPKNLSEVTEVNILFIRQYSMVGLYLVPSFVLLLAVLLGKRGGKLNEESK